MRPEPHSLSVSQRHYLRAAIAPATRDAYNSARENYQAHCLAQGHADYDITSHRVAAWITELAERGQHAGNTIAAYLSAISTWWVERGAGDPKMQDASNPTQVAWVQRILTGIKNDRAQVDQNHRQARYVEPLLMSAVVGIKPHLKLYEDKDLTTFAAAALGVAALLRPNALLGNSRHPERGVLCDHLRFFTATASPMDRTALGVPDYFTLFVPIDKTDQLRKGNTRVIAAATAVQAVWALWKKRPAGQRLFVQPSGEPLSTQSLVKRIKKAFRESGYAHADKFAAKAFRRGGASTLTEAGVDGDAVAAAGNWSARAQTYKVYVGAQQRRQQQLEASRKMEYS